RDNSSRVPFSRSRFTWNGGAVFVRVSIATQPNQAGCRWQKSIDAYLTGNAVGISYLETGYLRPHGDGDTMTKTSIEERLATTGVVPLVQAGDPETALSISKALRAGGRPISEVVHRKEDALNCLEAVSENLQDAVVRAGTGVTRSP